MQALYPERCSEPPGPRVMGRRPRGRGLSVDRGRCRPSIELRNHPLSAPTLLGEGEGNTVRRVIRERRTRRSGVVDLAHVLMSSTRDSGGPVPGLDGIQSQAGSGEVETTPGHPRGREGGETRWANTPNYETGS